VIFFQVFTEAFEVGAVPLNSPGALTFGGTAEKEGINEIVKGWCCVIHVLLLLFRRIRCSEELFFRGIYAIETGVSLKTGV
jgi:hypothetical protein